MFSIPKSFNLTVRKIANALLLIAFIVLLLLSGKSPTQQFNNEKNETEKIAAAFEDPCTKDSSYPCYKTALVSYIKQNGIKPAVKTLSQLSAKNQTVTFFCHSLAHDLGRTAFDMTKGDIGQIFREGDTSCWSGFFHGALEKAFSQSNDLVSTARDLCTKENGVEGSFLYYQCLHGLGHGLSARFDNEIYQALDVCEKLNDSYQQTSCYGGVFMENYVADGVNHKTKYTDAADPIAPCNKVKESQKYNCYQLVSIQILRLNGYNFKEAFVTCTRSESNFLRTCYQSVGRDISGYTAEDPNRSVAYCNEANSFVAEEECVMAIASDSVYSKSSEKNVNSICGKVEESLRERCYSSAGGAINVLYDNLDKKRQACETFPETYQSACKRMLSD